LADTKNFQQYSFLKYQKATKITRSTVLQLNHATKSRTPIDPIPPQAKKPKSHRFLADCGRDTTTPQYWVNGNIDRTAAAAVVASNNLRQRRPQIFAFTRQSFRGIWSAVEHSRTFKRHSSEFVAGGSGLSVRLGFFHTNWRADGQFSQYSRLAGTHVRLDAIYARTSIHSPLILYLGIGEEPKIMLIFIGVFFFNSLMVMDTVKFVPKDLIEATYMLGGNRWEILTQVIFPHVLPGILDASRINLAAAWQLVIVSELIAQPKA
jgi:ABC-type nitrate/sulfonate/bicarbonate transport system, permease component